MDITIEKAEVGDAEKLLDIYAPYVKNTAITFEYEVPSVDEFRERIKTISAKYPYIKALKDGEIVGYAYANIFKSRPAYDWAVESTIYIKENQKKQGIGKALYNVLENSLKEMGILNIYACISTPKTEDEYLTFDSIKFHTKQGYTEVATFEKCGYKFGRWYNSTWMGKYLGEHSKNPQKVDFGNWKI